MGSLLSGRRSNQLLSPDNMAGNIRLQTSAMGMPIPICHGIVRIASNLLWYGDFVAIAVATTESISGGGKGGGGGGGGITTITYNYQAAVIWGLCEGPITNVLRLWRGKSQTSPSAEGLSVFLGTYAQLAWSHLTTNHPSQAIGYRGVAYAASANYQLGANAELPNNTFEVVTTFQYGLPGQSAKNFTALTSAKTFVTQTEVVQKFFGGTYFGGGYYFGSSIVFKADLLSTAHGFVNGTVVRLSTTGTLPGGFSAGVDYFIVVAAANTFQLSATPGGPSIFPTSAGTGTQTATAFFPNFQSTAHGFIDGQRVQLSTTGTLPSGLSPGAYVIVRRTTNAFQLITNLSYQLFHKTNVAQGIIPRSVGSGTHTATGFVIDANPKDILTDLLTNVNYGAGFSATELGDWTQWSNYCIANSMFLSSALVAQEAMSDIVARFCMITNSLPFFSEGKLKIVPYGDQVITANGVTFTPNVTALYALTDDNFENQKEPLVCTRSRSVDAYNQVQIKFFDRDNDYVETPAEAKDQGNIEQFGLRAQSPLTFHEIFNGQLAKTVAYLVLQRVLYIRNVYRGTLPINYILLEPLDIVTVTDVALGLNQTPLRVTSVSESKSGKLQVEFEEFPNMVSTAALYGPPVLEGYGADYNADPGVMNSPVIFDGPGNLTNSGYELWVAQSGGANWGGANVYVATDNVNFKQIGTTYGSTRYGQVTADFAPGSDPDTTHILSVDLTASLGSLTTATQADADNNNTLCYVDDELVTYQEALLTAQFKYDLKTYLRRGRYNSVIVNHVAGEPFIRLDGTIFKYVYDPTVYAPGSVIYIKLQGFNQFGGHLQDLATLGSYPFTIGSSITNPDNVTGFSASQSGNVVLFQWNLLNAPNVAGYEIRFQRVTATPSWASASPITQVTRGTQVTTAKVPPGNWTFLIAARDVSQKYSLIPDTANLIVVATGNIILVGDNLYPDWIGCTLTNLLIHWQGELVPESTKFADEMTNAELFEQFVPYPATSCACESPVFDILADVSVRIFATITAQLGRGITVGSIQPNLQVDYRTDAGSFDGFESWTINTVIARFIKYKLNFAPANGNGFVDGFTPTADALPLQQTGNNISIQAGGQHIPFTTRYQRVPNVQVTALSVGLLATVQNIDLTGFDTNIINVPAGNDVGGVENWIAIGV